MLRTVWISTKLWETSCKLFLQDIINEVLNGPHFYLLNNKKFYKEVSINPFFVNL
jgi:hypothetical protein